MCLQIRVRPVPPLQPVCFQTGRVGICCGPIISYPPLSSPMSYPPLVLRGAIFPSLSPSVIFPLYASSATHYGGDGARCWNIAPVIGSPHRCSWPCRIGIAWSCTSTLTHILIRHWRLDTPIVLDPWCDPPAQSISPSRLSVLRSWLVGPSIFRGHFRL